MGRLILGTVLLAGLGGLVIGDDPKAKDKKAAAAVGCGGQVPGVTGKVRGSEGRDSHQ